MFSNPDALLARAIELFQRQQLEEAQRCLQQVLRVQPRNFDALHVMGVVLALRGQRDAALEHFFKAARIQPNHPRLNFNYARLLAEAGQDEKAVPVHQRAVQAAPDYAPAWLNYGQSLMRLQRLAEARECFERALALQTDYPEAQSRLASVLAQEGEHERALALFDQALARMPDLVDALFNKGMLLDDLRRYPEAADVFSEVVRLDPGYAKAWMNLGVALERSGQTARAIDAYRHASEADPSMPDPHHNRGILLLASRDYAQGWGEHEWRLEMHDVGAFGKTLSVPRWEGQRDCRLFVWGEQGIGDQILYGSMLPDLPARLDAPVHVAVAEKLLPLMQRSVPGVTFVPREWAREGAREGAGDRVAYDAHTPLGSLGRFLRPDVASFTGKGAYLRADPDQAARMRALAAAAGRPVCGLSWWSGNPNIGNEKSIVPALLQPLLELEGLAFANLQYSPTDADLQALRTLRPDFLDTIGGVDCFDDLDGLAAVIAACDVVVTVSNTTAHLAAALGKPTVLMMPFAVGTLWYWVPVDRRTPWYPSVTVLRQSAQGDWQGPIRQARELLEKHLG